MLPSDNCLLVINPNQYNSRKTNDNLPPAEPHGNVCDTDYNQHDIVGLLDFMLFKLVFGNTAPLFTAAPTSTP